MSDLQIELRDAPVLPYVIVVVVLAAASLAGCHAAGGRKPSAVAASASPSAPTPPPVGACYQVPNNASAREVGVHGLTKVACDQPHLLETYHVGQFPADASTGPIVPQMYLPESRAAFADCEKVVAAYTGGTPDQIQVGTVFWGYDTADWTRGDNRVRCFAAKYSDGPKLKGSVKGIGNRKPQTA